MSDRFKIEEAIFDCWNVVSDVKMLRENVDNLDADQLDNYLLGLETIYAVKFGALYEAFEQSLKT